MPGDSSQPLACSEIVVASETISPAELRRASYSAIVAFGIRLVPARERVNGAITIRLESVRSPSWKG